MLFPYLLLFLPKGIHLKQVISDHCLPEIFITSHWSQTKIWIPRLGPQGTVCLDPIFLSNFTDSSLSLSLYFRHMGLLYAPNTFFPLSLWKCCSLFPWSLHSWLILILPDSVQTYFFRNPFPNHPILWPHHMNLPCTQFIFFITPVITSLSHYYFFIFIYLFFFPTCLPWALLFQQLSDRFLE